ncbi:MAG: hypothetical protein DMF58_19730, partial [Acidobacteria bacterium]
RRVRRAHAQRRVENEQRFAYGVKHVLGKILKVRDERPAVRGPMLHVAENWLSLLGLKAEGFGHGSPPDSSTGRDRKARPVES